MRNLPAVLCIAGLVLLASQNTSATAASDVVASDPTGHVESTANNSPTNPTTSAEPQFTIPEELRENPPFWLKPYLTGLHPAPRVLPKRPGVYSDSDWAAAINATWGPGMPGSTKDSLFLKWWTAVAGYAATFFNIDTAAWSDAFATYAPGVVDYDTVSRGRFAAIMFHMSLRCRDIHVISSDQPVAYTHATPGVPLLYIGGTGDNTHFGAALTPLPDSTLLVYQTVPNHPLGLVPGDVVLGYDRMPWKDRYPQLLAAQLPIGLVAGGLYGGNDKAFTHDMLMSAGMNWHLFDTIDVVKYATGDTLHLSTAPLLNQPTYIWASEQLPIPGITKPNFGTPPVTWGVVPGTHIGYIYHLWLPGSSSKILFNSALTDLIDSQHVAGIIIDFRTNYGGSSDGYPLLHRLFDSVVQPMNWYYRCATCCKQQMCKASGFDAPFRIYGDSVSPLLFHGPVAVLTGPNAVSMGDQMPHALSLRPRTRIFGKPTGGHFNGYATAAPFANPFVTAPDWYFFLPTVCSAQGIDNSKFMIHSTFPSAADYPEADFQEVWLTRDGVAHGVDDVVEAAKAWIISLDRDQDGVLNEQDNCPDTYDPGTANQSFSINYMGDVDFSTSLSSFDIIYLARYVFQSGPAPLPCAAAGDVDCTGKITASDIISLVNQVFKAQSPQCDKCTLIATGAWTCPF